MAPYRHNMTSTRSTALRCYASTHGTSCHSHSMYLGIGNRLADIGLTTELGKTAVTELVAGTSRRLVKRVPPCNTRTNCDPDP